MSTLLLKTGHLDRSENMETFKGPLGSHRNYIVHIALGNYVDYDALKKQNVENKRQATPDKYKAFRYYLNAVESFNNILDYLYFEFEDKIKQTNVNDFRKAVHKKYSALRDLADLANAYKHCVRAGRISKNTELPWAKDLQQPTINVEIKLNEKKTDVGYDFVGPTEENEMKLSKVWKFWIDYQNNPNSSFHEFLQSNIK